MPRPGTASAAAAENAPLVLTPAILREAVGAQSDLSRATAADLHNRRLGVLRGLDACPKLRR